MTDSRLVGRLRELAMLDGLLASARAGRGGLVLVEGEAGAGKTALADVLVTRARAAGVRTAWGSCLEGEGAGAYRPWIRILQELGGSASVLLDPSGGEEGDRQQLFDDVVAALRPLPGGPGLLLVVDDLHWADVSTVRLLQAVAAAAADAPMLVVGLLRAHEVGVVGRAGADLAALLAEMRRQRAVETLTLASLTPGEVAQLATLVAGRPPPESLVRAVQARADGNPLFVRELVRLSEASDPAGTGLPRGVRDVISRRLDLLPAPTRDVLRQGAVVGREFTLTMLSTLADESPAAILDLLEPALAAEFLGIEGSRLRFAHVLTREVLYAELSTLAQQHLHARVATVLRESATDTGPVDTLAFHLRRAAPLQGPDEALTVTRQAAGRARSQLAYEHAAFQYREAIGLLPPTGDETVRAELLLNAAQCEFRAGAVEEAWRCCLQAADSGRATGTPAILADAAVVLRGITNSPVTAPIHALCQEVLPLVAETDAVRAAKVMAQLVITADPFAAGGDPDLSRRALHVAEATGDPDARFLAMQARVTALVDGRYVLERLSIGDRALRLAEETGHAEYAAWGHTWRLDALWELGRRVQIDAELAALTTVVGRLRQPLWQWRLRMMRATIATYEGRFALARALADEAYAIGTAGGHAEAAHFHLVFRAHIATLDGVGLDEALADVADFVATAPFLARAWLVQLLAAGGRIEEARELWATIGPHVTAFPRNAPEWIVAAAGNTEVCLALEDRDAGAAIAGVLTPYADRQVIVGAHTPCYGPATFHLGRLAALNGDWDLAERHLLTALASATAMDSGPYEVMIRFALARVLFQNGRASLARDHGDRARRIARRLGMPLVEASAASGSDDRRPGGLTAREEQVAALVADGLSNRRIAHRLQLSERTAENHVTHILTKLGFDSRARIASWYTAQRGGPPR